MTEETIQPQTSGIPEFLLDQKESVKLIKNTKGYNWEIKLLSLDLDQLEKINKEMQRRFDNPIKDLDN